MGLFIGRREAVRLLGPGRLDLLRRCVDDAWTTYDEHLRAHLPVPSRLPTIIHELVAEQARKHLTEPEGFRVRDGEANERFLITVDTAVIIQFKKLTQDMLTRNNPTETSERFDRQQTGIEGIPDLPRLTVGYHLWQLGTAIAGIYLAFNIGRENVWYYDLNTGEHSIAFDFPGAGGPSPAEQERAERRRQHEQQEPGINLGEG